MTEKLTKRPPIAVVGVSALFPGSSNAEGFWRDILAGKDLLTPVPSSHWLVEDYYDADPTAPDKTYANRGGFLKDIDFDAIGWGIPPSIIPATDTSQLLALIVAEQVLRDAARGQFDTMDRSRISCILGVTSAQELLATMVSRLQRPVWVKSLRDHGVAESEVQAIADRIADHYQPWQESSFPGLLGNVVAGRIANRLNLGGTNCVTDAACASTFSAIQMAVQELYLGDSDLVITGGVDTLNDIFMYMCFSKTPALSPSGDCRPFSDQADGTMLGEGLGMVALKRLDDAVRDGDRIYGVLRGVGASSDGRSKSVYAPVSEGQAVALRRAYEHAGYDPTTVELMEAHGTGTKAGDVAEFNGLKLVFKFDEQGHNKQWCAIGSVKSQIGHTKAAAGAAGLFKAVMALHHKTIPPTAKVEKLNPKLGVEASPFYVNTFSRPWVRGTDHPRRASVSAFGFGGSNFHITLEEYTGENRHERARSLPFELVVLSGNDGAALAKSAREFAARASGKATLARLAWESQHAFSADAKGRLAVVASDVTDLAKKLEKAASMLDKNPSQGFEMPDGTVASFVRATGDVAFVFPGQGSQYVNMGADLAMAFDLAIAPWDAAADLDFGGQKLHQVVFPIPKFSDADRDADEIALRATEWAQPGIGAASLSALAMMRALGVQPKAVAGHSFGEVTALYAAGVLSQTEMLQVARKRGELMAAAADVPGAMSAVSATIDVVEAVLKETNDPNVVVANHNAPDQVVISGTVEGVAAATRLFETRGVTVKPLAVSTAFHSPVVAASVKPFTAFLKDIEFAKADLPVYSGESADVYEGKAADKRGRLGRQIANPVRFVSMVEKMYANGARIFVEVGPGSVLTKLVGSVLTGRDHVAVSLDRKGKNGLESFYRGLGQLAAAGVPMNFTALWSEYGEPLDIEALPKPKLAVPINGANYEKAYPPKGGAAALPKPNPEKPAPQPVERVVEVEKIVRVEVPVEVPVHVPVAAGPGAPVTASTAGVAPAHSPQWLATWQEAQRQNAMALMAFQHAMAQSQSSFMQTIQASFDALGGAGTTLPHPAAGQVQTMAPMSMPTPSYVPTFASAPAPVASVTATNSVIPRFASAPTQAPAASAPAPAPAPAASPAALAASTADVTQAMLDTVAAKTGYPMEMLDLSMDLENDLGVDSIKRVEILASVQDRVPGLPAVDATTMASLRTLGEIVSFMQKLAGPALPAPAVVMPAAPAQVAAAPAPAPSPGVDLHALMFAAVAEKTGYPSEMLELSMDLEGDLGIDSIKRVEILAAVQEQAPGMPEVDTNRMGALKTLGEIVDYMQGLMPAGAAAPAVMSTPSASAHVVASAPAAPTVDLHALMFAAVAEKTGYPSEMLELSMDLEGDLGIDSIKRVEILAAVQEQAPGMPEVDTNRMGALKTLGEIVDYMQGLMPAGAAAPVAMSTPSASAHVVASAPAAPAVDLHALMFAAVAEKTGYPSDMLELSMDLEGDLGIDSIKRVEILAAVQEQAPGMPEVDTNRMGALKTLGEIVDYMQGLMPAGAAAPVAMSTPSASAHVVTSVPAAPAVDLHALMFAAVAEKTGYPSDMLELSMDLEGDLGIDSIKRVEILAAVQEQAPGMPEVDTNRMGALKTLGEIVTYMQGLMPGGASAATPSAPSVPATAAAAVASRKSTNLGRFALEMVATPAPGLAPRGVFGHTVYVLGDDIVGPALVAALAERGVTASYAATVPADAQAAVFLGGLTDVSGDDEAIAVNRTAFQAARALAPKLAKNVGLFVTVQDTGGNFGLSKFPTQRAWLAGLTGLVKTAAQEWPTASLKAIDLERGGRTAADIASAIADELTQGGNDIEVGLHADGTRVCPNSFLADVQPGTPVVGPNDVIVVSGGARGVTASCVIEWARRSHAKFVLLGRSPLEAEPTEYRSAHTDAELKAVALASAKAAGEKITPAELTKRASKVQAGRDIRATLAAINGAGGQAMYVATSVTDASALENAFNEVRAQWGGISGIVHGAGVLADKYIADQSDKDFDYVFDTKIQGLRAMLAATAKDDLKVLCMFSSVAGRCGNNGQANYAMANEVLNKVADAAAYSNPNMLVRSLGWGPWEGGMVSPELKAHFDRLGVPMIPLHLGALMFADEMESTQKGQVELVLGGEPRAAALLGGGLGKPEALEVHLSAKTHGFLEGHSISGAPVVPVVLVLEWFSRMASAYRRDLHLAAVKEVKVLKGMRLDNFHGAGDTFVLTCAPVPNGSDLTLALELRGADGTLHYRATASMTRTRPGVATAASPTGLHALNNTKLYGDVLFHTRDFQVLLNVDGVGPNGIEGATKGVRDASWNWDAWTTDVAALDGGLQMLLLWAREELGGAALPMGIGEFRWTSQPSAGPIRCVAQCKASGTQKAVADVTFVDQAGVPLAEMKHVELIMRPNN